MKDYRGNRALNMGAVVLFMFGISFLFNFLWESLHAVYFYQRHDLDALNYVPMMLHVSFVDGLLVLGLYLGVALGWLDLFWIRPFTAGQISAFLAIGVVVAAAIEYRAVFYYHKWLYKQAMPTLFGLGISPLVQLSITGLIAIWLTRELLYGRGLLLHS